MHSTTKNTDGPLVAVVGATGQQGGATAGALLDAGARVRALVRDPAKPAARALAERGAELVPADLTDPASLRAALRGVDRLFAMTTFAGARGVAGEVEQGRALADAAAEVGVGHVVYSSVGGAERSTGVPHFESKRRVEEHLESLGRPVTFLRPVFFMENLVGQGPTVEDGALVVRLPLPADVPVQMVAVRDIGAAAAAALLDPARVSGGALELAGACAHTCGRSGTPGSGASPSTPSCSTSPRCCTTSAWCRRSTAPRCRSRTPAGRSPGCSRPGRAGTPGAGSASAR